MRRVLPFLFLLAACGPEERVASTQVTLRVELPDRSLADSIDEVRATLSVRSGDQWTERSRTTVPKRLLKFPFDIPIVPSRKIDENAELDVRVEAVDDRGVQVAFTRAGGRFRPNESIGIRSQLAACTRPDPTCDSSDCYGTDCQVCVLAECVPVGGASEVDDGNDDPNIEGPSSATDRDAASHEGGTAPASDGGTAASDAGPASDAAAPLACTMEQAKACPQPYPCVALPGGGYTCRGQMADWPMPDNVPGAKFAPKYTSKGKTVLDEITQLEWQANLPTTYPSCDRSNADAGVPERGAYCSREQADAYCKSLGEQKYAGYDDWRLPSMIELVSLAASDGEEPAIDTGFFDDYGSFVASSWGTGPAESYIVDYSVIGYAGIRAGAIGRVRCVRAGALPKFATPKDRYQVMGEVVLDRATTLLWQRNTSALMSVEKGGSYCAGLGPGYRLPSPNELMTLMNPALQRPRVDLDAFPGTLAGSYSHARQAPVIIDFAKGSRQWGGDYDGYTRCVRHD